MRTLTRVQIKLIKLNNKAFHYIASNYYNYSAIIQSLLICIEIISFVHSTIHKQYTARLKHITFFLLNYYLSLYTY